MPTPRPPHLFQNTGFVLTGPGSGCSDVDAGVTSGGRSGVCFGRRVMSFFGVIDRGIGLPLKVSPSGGAEMGGMPLDSVASLRNSLSNPARNIVTSPS